MLRFTVLTALSLAISVAAIALNSYQIGPNADDCGDDTTTQVSQTAVTSATVSVALPSSTVSTNPVNDHDGGNDATSQVSPPAETSTVRTSGKNSTMITDSNGFFNGGIATWFNQENTAGACGHVHSDYDYIVALNLTIFDQTLCGRELLIIDLNTGVSATATVADACSGCNTYSLDLSIGLFQQFENLEKGTFPMKWKWI